MRALFICGFLMAAPLSAALIPSQKAHSHLPEGPKINVLLEKDITSALLEVRGHYSVLSKDTGSILSSGNMGKRFVVHAIQDGLRWGEEYPDTYQISVIPTRPDTRLFVNGLQYKGAISVYHVRDNRIIVVNETPIEEYLKSTLSLKFTDSFSQEALCALVIAARTEAYARAIQSRTSSRPWEITAQEVGYFGYGVTQQSNRVEEAIDRTRFMVMESVEDGRPSQNTHLSPAKAEELAELGCDAKKILQSTFPNHKLGITIDPNEVALR